MATQDIKFVRELQSITRAEGKQMTEAEAEAAITALRRLARLALAMAQQQAQGRGSKSPLVCAKQTSANAI